MIKQQNDHIARLCNTIEKMARALLIHRRAVQRPLHQLHFHYLTVTKMKMFRSLWKIISVLLI